MEILHLIFCCSLLCSVSLWPMQLQLGVNNITSKPVNVSFAFYVQTDSSSTHPEGTCIEHQGVLQVEAGKYSMWQRDAPKQEGEGKSYAFLGSVQIGRTINELREKTKGRAWYLNIWEEDGTIKSELMKFLECYREEGRTPGTSIGFFLKAKKYLEQCQDEKLQVQGRLGAARRITRFFMQEDTGQADE